MAYKDIEEYINDKERSKKKTTKRSTSTSSRKNLSKSKSTSKNRRKVSTTYRTRTKSKSNLKNTKKKGSVKNRKKKFKKVKNTFLALLAVSLIGAGIVGYAGNTDNQAPLSSSPSISATVQPSQTPGLNKDQISESFKKEESELKNYKDYCYYSGYEGKTYLFCPEEYVLKIAEHVINKINYEYECSGNMSKLDNGKYIPDCISPELLASICKMESSFRIESKNGDPLGSDRNVAKSNRAEGMMQQKPSYVEDANNFSKMFGGNGYTINDRYNPVTAMEICVTNLNRVYRSYLTQNKATYQALCKNGYSEDKIIAALIISYYQGEGNMSKWAKEGILDSVIKNPNSTNNYGAAYYRTVLGYKKDITERNMPNQM